MKLDVVYAARIQVGDIIAGEVNPDAPTRPVNDFATALTVRNVSEVPAAVYTLWYSDDPTSGLHSRPHRGTDQFLVIRP